MGDGLRTLAIRAGYFTVRMALLALPDRWLAAGFRGLARLAYAVTGDRARVEPVSDLAGVFAAGPPYTVTIRKMMRRSETEIVVSAIKCLARRSPYGAV